MQVESECDGLDSVVRRIVIVGTEFAMANPQHAIGGYAWRDILEYLVLLVRFHLPAFCAQPLLAPWRNERIVRVVERLADKAAAPSKRVSVMRDRTRFKSLVLFSLQALRGDRNNFAAIVLPACPLQLRRGNEISSAWCA